MTKTSIGNSATKHSSWTRTNFFAKICKSYNSCAKVPFLKTKDAQGQTPLMLAVTCRSYKAVLELKTILEITNDNAATRDSIIFLAGSAPDQSRQGILRCNDTCSFTWIVWPDQLAVLLYRVLRTVTAGKSSPITRPNCSSFYKNGHRHGFLDQVSFARTSN
uniref:E3 ubiquitin-protein ligase hyd n=1 Tax=Culex pipiens TaxID=7175 RepID=A0A8D8G5D2_CULPI